MKFNLRYESGEVGADGGGKPETEVSWWKWEHPDVAGHHGRQSGQVPLTRRTFVQWYNLLFYVKSLKNTWIFRIFHHNYSLLAMQFWNKKISFYFIKIIVGIISDLFPGVELPKPDYEVLYTALKKVLKSKNLQATDFVITKITQVCALNNNFKT